CLLSLGVRVF
nr:immunoglobulin light chain junction region [Homo sapiens]